MLPKLLIQVRSDTASNPLEASTFIQAEEAMYLDCWVAASLLVPNAVARMANWQCMTLVLGGDLLLLK